MVICWLPPLVLLETIMFIVVDIWAIVVAMYSRHQLRRYRHVLCLADRSE